MATSEANSLTARLPTKEEIRNAADAAHALAVAMEVDGQLRVAGTDGPVGIAPAIGDLIIELLGHVAEGKMVTLVPVGAMLTTQQAAEMMNVSRPFLVRLLKRGEIPFEQVGSHRRVRITDLLRYRDRKSREQDEALAELQRLGQEFDAA